MLVLVHPEIVNVLPWDNLVSCKHLLVLAMDLCFQGLYCPTDKSLEFMFNTIEKKWKPSVYQIW
jgi:hypothetical protein